MDNTNMNTDIVNDPLIAPPKGKGYHRWLQTTRKAYINKQKKLGLTILKAKNINNLNNSNNSNNLNNINNHTKLPFRSRYYNTAIIVNVPPRRYSFIDRFKYTK